MSDKKKMKIMYLNVNGFAGNENKKNANTTCHEELSQQICNNEKTKDADMIFLSEVDPHSSATSGFIDQINKINRENTNEEYDVLTPSAGYEKSEDTLGKSCTKDKLWKNIPGYSCTICLKKETLEDYTNKGNGFNTNQKDGDYLHFCKILKENYNEVTVLIGIHWAIGGNKENNKIQEEKGNEVERIAKFILSLKRLLKFLLGKKINVILFGDTNANPDVNLEDAVNNDDTDKIEAYMNNCIFEHLMNELGLHEIEPKEKLATFVVKTRIDRVFTNMSGVTVEVVPEFIKNNLSDHEALLITYEED